MTERAVSRNLKEADHVRSQNFFPQILVVEDDPMLREVLCIALRSEGFHCLEAENGLDALRILETETVDAIISDNQMPKMNGLEFFKRVRQRYQTQSPPSILMSGDHDPFLPQKAADLECSAFLAKPFSYKKLCASLASILQEQHL